MKMFRGVADSFAAAYVCMYIVKCVLVYGCEIEDSVMMLEILKEFMLFYVNVFDEIVDEDLVIVYIFRFGLRRIEYSEFMDFVMEWLIECCVMNFNLLLLYKVLYMGGEILLVLFFCVVFCFLLLMVVRENVFKFIAFVGATFTDEDLFEYRDVMVDCY